MRIVVVTLVCALALMSGVSAFAANFTAIADTYTDSASDKAGTNFGSSGITAVSRTRITLIRFNPDQVAQSTGGTGLLNVKVLVAKNQSNGMAVHLVQAPWNEKTVTANSMPAIAPVALDQKSISAANQGTVVSLNVSAALAQWNGDPASNFGLALVPTAPLPNLQLGSREGGSPAVLAVSGATQDNDVTVAPSGADYTSPAVAANNAFQGDTWCVSPRQDKHCAIHVAAGIYVGGFALPAGVDLLGDGKGDTLIFGGLHVANSLITDLSLIATGPAIDGRSEGVAQLERVSVRATLLEADSPADAVSAAFVGAGVLLTDSDVTVESNDASFRALAFDCLDACGEVKVVRSDISVVARVAGAGFLAMQDSGRSTSVEVEDSTISVLGKSSAICLNSLDEDNQLIRFVRTSIAVSSSGTASGFTSSDFFMRGFPHVELIDSKVGVHGDAGATFLDWEAGQVLLDGSVVDATTVGARMRFGAITVRRSQLTASQTALDLLGADADIESSFLRGATAIHAKSDEISPYVTHVQARSSVLAGAVTLESDATATCERVYDQTFALRRADCSGP